MREWDLLRHVFQSNAQLGPRVTIPPGDDMGGILLGDKLVLVTVDQLADGVHVDLATTPIDKIARKAITRNLSDVAAMAAKPVGAVVAASLPRDMDERLAKRLFDGMQRTASEFDCPLFGGDVSMWDGRLLLTVTVLAEPDGTEPVLRSTAQVGDLVYVTGQLGGSLETLPTPDLYTHHLDFCPRITIARILAGHPVTRPHAMMDLSDGLASDLSHICRTSNVSARIHALQLPISPGCEAGAARTGKPTWQHAVGDGEDYELLFTAPPDTIPDLVEGVPVTPVGIIEPADAAGPRVTIVLADGTVHELADLGWEHRT